MVILQGKIPYISSLIIFREQVNNLDLLSFSSIEFYPKEGVKKCLKDIYYLFG
jgi:hypothetical protein